MAVAAVAIVLDFEGATLDHYDATRKLMELEPEGTAPEGALFHWVTKTDTGVRVTDVWKTREAFDRFAAERIGPLSAQAGFPNPPTITYYEVHNYLTEG
jgi:hypothetical protein